MIDFPTLHKIADALDAADRVLFLGMPSHGKRQPGHKKQVTAARQYLAATLCAIAEKGGCPNYACALGVQSCPEHSAAR